MKKLISILLAMTIAVSIFSVCTTASAAATTFNGKSAVKGGYVYTTYYMRAPEKSENIEAQIKYSKGLKLVAIAYSKEIQKGSFIHNEKLKNEIRFSDINIMKHIDFTKTKAVVKMKFKVTGTGKQYTSFNLQCFDGVSGKKYAKGRPYYKKLKFARRENILTYSIKLNKSSVKIKKGRTYTLKKTITPSSASKSVTWSTNNKRVATVNKYGKVYAKKKGTCYITCKAKDGSKKYRKCKVIVY